MTREKTRLILQRIPCASDRRKFEIVARRSFDPPGYEHYRWGPHETPRPTKGKRRAYVPVNELASESWLCTWLPDGWRPEDETDLAALIRNAGEIPADRMALLILRNNWRLCAV